MMAMFPDAESATDTTIASVTCCGIVENPPGSRGWNWRRLRSCPIARFATLEAGTTVPSLLTLACLRQVTALGQLTEPLAVSSSGVMNHDG